MRYSTWILAYSPIEGLVPFSCKLTEPVWWILQRYLVTVCFGMYLRVLCFSMLSSHLHIFNYMLLRARARSLAPAGQGDAASAVLIFVNGVNFKKHCYLSCSTCRAARYLECIFDALEKIACICGALNKSKFKAQHAVVNSSFAVSNAKSTTHAKTTFPLKDFLPNFWNLFSTNFCAQDPSNWGVGLYCIC